MTNCIVLYCIYIAPLSGHGLTCRGALGSTGSKKRDKF